MSDPQPQARLERIRAAYERRGPVAYSPLEAWVRMVRQERERAVIDWLVSTGFAPLDRLRLVECGCGSGANLLDFLRLGFAPERLVGVDLIEGRIIEARRRLPQTVALHCGDTSSIDLPSESFDVVFQSMMCSSILDDELLEAVARRMWDLARPGGGILWYDFTFDNPRNPDVRGLPVRRVRQLFPQASSPRVRRLTLAPPIARAVSRIHPALYTVLNAVPQLRTHVLCWLPKAAR